MSNNQHQNRIISKRIADAAATLGRPDLAARILPRLLLAQYPGYLSRGPNNPSRGERRLLGRAVRVARRAARALGIQPRAMLLPGSARAEVARVA